MLGRYDSNEKIRLQLLETLPLLALVSSAAGTDQCRSLHGLKPDFGEVVVVIREGETCASARARSHQFPRRQQSLSRLPFSRTIALRTCIQSSAHSIKMPS